MRWIFVVATQVNDGTREMLLIGGVDLCFREAKDIFIDRGTQMS